MGRFTKDGKAKTATKSEEFHQAMIDAGSVECKVCQVKIGEGKRGNAIHVCKSCVEYYCDEHVYRHNGCENGK